MTDLTLLPPNHSELERAAEQATVRASALNVPLHRLWNAQTCPASLLPWLAWALRVDVWDSAWATARKRDVIAAALDVHITRGTLGALERALDALGMHVEVLEWFDYPEAGDPYHFSAEVDLTDQVIQDDTEDQVLAAIERFKPLRSRLDDLFLFQPVTGTVYGGFYTTSTEDIVVGPPA